MQAARQGKELVLAFNAVESRIVLRILRSIIENYRLRPDQLDPRVAAVWYSSRGCQTAKMSAEETRDWLETLHSYKSANLQCLEEWTRSLAGAKPRPQLRLRLEEAASLVTVLNDHRLMAAARNDIGQAEMDMHLSSAIGRLKPAQQAALYEIHFLAYLIEEILRHTAPEAAGWMEG